MQERFEEKDIKFLSNSEMAWESGPLNDEVAKRFKTLSFGQPLRELLANEIIRSGFVTWQGIHENISDPLYKLKHDAIFLGYQEVGRRILEASSSLKGKEVEYARPNVVLKIEDDNVIREGRWWETNPTRLDIFRYEGRMVEESDQLIQDPKGLHLLNYIYNRNFQYMPSRPDSKGFLKGQARYSYLYQFMLDRGAMSDDLRSHGKRR